MKRIEEMTNNKLLNGLAHLSLIILAIIAVPSITSAVGPGTVCVLQIQSSGEILSVLVDEPTNFNIAVLVPEEPDKRINLPMSCDIMGTLALAVANQKNHRVTVTTQIFTNQGELICANDSLGVPRNGARGIVFSGCQ